MGELDRIRWHCRRGLLELDLVLAKFLERWLPALNDEELQAFKRILEQSDNDLWDQICGRAEVLGDVESRLVTRLREL
ncbi:MAG TPA: succinate dehydrogenase assembly factor 2 [Burkholderiales bacterium]|nr:succinate dehydrogenase assembly factor 2 [Burkholderiales bacterium]